ncbi:uncharacterized protein [Paramisgurnus dabryanus]|uniref:uncharacterized protein isoform X2 n=2 Tax=Paramisgurnus dabryanus TaxID=90735 RepID=UPI0031F4392E
MMMNFSIIAVIMSVMIMGTNGRICLNRCCTSVSTKEITSPITGFRLQTRNGPCVDAVIFYTAEGRWCSHWKPNWVKQKIQEFRKLQLEVSDEIQKITSTVSKPLMKITPTVSTPLMKITPTVSTPLMKITSTVSKPLMKITSTVSTPMMKTSSKALDIPALCRQCKRFLWENCFDYTRTMKTTFSPDVPMTCFFLFQFDLCIESPLSRFYKEDLLMCFSSFS